ncbi:hypothetical protein AB0I54_45270 [Streptomyces sp. NPDC050625]|uniref:hypothetical protein n=1 Tax=Streptomyces sp. NPDC050625 TaxID=3154629 RepID=UPI003431B95C
MAEEFFAAVAEEGYGLGVDEADVAGAVDGIRYRIFSHMQSTAHLISRLWAVLKEPSSSGRPQRRNM